MKICVTGSAGFLGSHIARWFSDRGHAVVGLDNLIGGYLSNYPDTVVVDIAQVETVKSLCKGVDVIYHCACTAYEGLSVFSPTLVTRNTLTITAAMLSACVHNGVKRFIYCSSMARYGRGHPPFVEAARPEPEDPYGIAKVAAEQLVERLAEAHGFEYVIAVPHNIYGPYQKYDDPYRNVAAIMINRVLQELPPVIYGDGMQTRCFSYIDDVLNTLIRLCDEPDVSGEVFNIGPDEGAVSINELAHAVQTLCGTSMDPVYFPGRPCEVKHAVCSSGKIRRWFDYETKTQLYTGLDKLAQWIAQRGPKPFDYHLPLEFVTDKTPRTWRERLL